MMEMPKSLKLHGMAQALGELASWRVGELASWRVGELAAQVLPPTDRRRLCSLDCLLKAEMAAREIRSLAYQMKVARFPAYRDLNGFDFGCSDVNEATVCQLHRCEFVTSAQNVVLVGGPGTGKRRHSAMHASKQPNTIEAVFASSRPLNPSMPLSKRSS